MTKTNKKGGLSSLLTRGIKKRERHSAKVKNRGGFFKFTKSGKLDF